MATRLALILVPGVPFTALSSLSIAQIRFALGSDRVWEIAVMALMVAAFLVGAGLVLLFGAVRDLARFSPESRRARRERGDEAVGEVYHRGVDAELAGRAAEAVEAYEEVIRREPGHAGAHVRLGRFASQRGDSQGELLHSLQALRADDRPQTRLAAAAAYRHAGRPDDAIALYREVLAGDPNHLAALRGLRDTTVELGHWAEALPLQERLVQVAPAEERAAERGWLAGIHYERGSAKLGDDDPAGAITEFREALRAQSDFVPAIVALGDAHLRAGDASQALRVWERGLDARPALPVLARIEQRCRAEGSPRRMIALYQQAVAHAPEDLAVAVALGRVYFELSMLDEAAEQFQKIEMRAPDLPSIHGYLGAIFEQRGQAREAFEEYRRALRATGSFEWPYRCAACGAAHPGWVDRCPSCRRWNTLRP